jgi:hypothetical protein
VRNHMTSQTLRHPFRFLPIVLSALILASCSQVSSLWSDEPEAAEKVAEAKKEVVAEKKKEEEVHKVEEKDLKEEKAAETVEDKDFAKMQKDLKKDMADAQAREEHRQQEMAKAQAANGQQSMAPASQGPESVSRFTYNKEMIAVNTRIHALSKRVEEVSERVHNLAELLENIPSKVAELELIAAQNEEMMQNKSMTSATPAPKPKAGTAPKQLMKSSSGGDWGIQVGAYRTRAGAENAWSEMLINNAAVVELNDAKVHYVPYKVKKTGKQLTLIVLNEYASHKAATGACSEFKAQGIDCVAARIKS